ncbi:class I SAM-dependent methyltransferase [Actinocrinis puniceicyclus]|uniref:Class I SAM-dependent methyltransferase n=1 Tax=Actinocrinis puniceicyclus TaxID=977794 RepID=A0A8J7WIZ4_9ACTN|nr:class I SAM-dependent methyltransferase [Actinocrinis puniceicyclus]MBS2963148.1 class I SAM-dependent methyltransferase [Actinocrinis puniceicyclus]
MTRRSRQGYGGTGPGPITPDGCAVELYTRLPLGDEADIVQRAVPAGARILELGCGVGRVTAGLLRRGFTVTAVDESAEMLEYVSGARTVCSPIESLELDERFDAVMLGSFLVHAGDPQVRRGLLGACRRHVSDGGCVLIQREGDGWHDNVPREAPLADGLARVVSSVPVTAQVRSVHVEYVFPEARWTQTFLSRPLTDEAFEQALEQEAGLAVDAYLTDDRTWVRAVPRRPPAAATS